MTSQTISFGVLLWSFEFQLLDATGPYDFINSHGKEYLTACQVPFANKAPSITWHFISSDMTPTKPSCGPTLAPTCTYADCPPLDYLLVPGPDPSRPLPPGCEEFLKARFKEVKLLLTVCSGSMIIAQAGILDGLQVCSNKWMLRAFANAGILRKEVKWVGDRRWIKDGKVWSAGGVTAGIDLASEFIRVHFDPEIAEVGHQLAEYEPNPDQPDAFAKMLDGVKLS